MRRSFAFLLMCACSDSFLQPKESEPTNIDNRLTLKGEVCTSPPTPGGFPVKVVLVVDQSGSMCVSDPPGSQQMGSFCADALANITMNSGVPIPPEPARVRALKKLFAQFATQPNVQVSILPFETNVVGTWPMSGGFAPLSDPANLASATARVNQLQAELGKGTDYQGALAAAYTRVADDILRTERSNPEQLPRTRYVVVFLTDGTPYPKCAANDMLMQYADHNNPDLLWADSFGAGPFCNLVDPMMCMQMGDPDCPYGFVAGTDRNQNYQLYSYVDQLMELKATHNIGDIRLHTVLLFNEEAVRNCGPICQDLYGRYPGVAQAQYPAAAHAIARHILQKMAERGTGIFQEFQDSLGVANFSLGALDYSSLESRNVMKTLLVRSLTAAPGEVDRVADADGDGLVDDMDNGFFMQAKWRAEQFSEDSDGDCFDDNFEVMHYDDGFRPDVKDGRGCDPASPLTQGCACRDTDGDGLSSFAEDYLKTKQNLFDSDGDGIPDGMEVRYGLDPLKPQAAGLDTDGDGLRDFAEFRADSNPIRRDNVFFDKNGYEYEVTPRPRSDPNDPITCYEFSVSNLQLVPTDALPGVDRIGFNLFKLYFAESPESGVATDYGTWRTACAWAQYAPPSVRVPAGPELTLPTDAFRAPSTMTTRAHYLTVGTCSGQAPQR